MSLSKARLNDPQKFDLTNLAKVGWGIVAAELSSNCYDVVSKFIQGDIQALETEMLARWGGNKNDVPKKIENIQRHVASLYAVVGKEFRQSEYSSLFNTSNVLKNPPEIDNHIVEELDLFSLINADHENFRYSLNERGTVFIKHMYHKYVVGLQPDETSKKKPRVLVYGQSQPS